MNQILAHRKTYWYQLGIIGHILCLLAEKIVNLFSVLWCSQVPCSLGPVCMGSDFDLCL